MACRESRQMVEILFLIYLLIGVVIAVAAWQSEQTLRPDVYTTLVMVFCWPTLGLIVYDVYKNGEIQ